DLGLRSLRLPESARSPQQCTSNRRFRSWERLRLLLGCPGQDREQRRNKMNTVILIGHLGGDAESRATRNNSTLTVLSLATNRVWKDRETGERRSQTTWHRCVSFGATATFAATLTKGAYVQIEGEIQTREYIANDGAKKSVTEVRIRRLADLNKAEKAAPQ